MRPESEDHRSIRNHGSPDDRPAEWTGTVFYPKTEVNMSRFYESEAVSMGEFDLLHPDAANIDSRIASLDWGAVAIELNESGNGLLKEVLTSSECEALASLYGSDEHFRSRVVMARHGFGRGEYKYFRYPLPKLLQQLRTALYDRLAPIANQWNHAMGIDTRYPDKHADFIDRCHNAGQVRPTPLLLQYGSEDYNCLHQDLYGEHVFPIQVAFLLFEPERDFTGGEFVLTEQRPRMQSRPEVVPLRQGDAVAFAVHHRPVQGTRGFYRVNMRHGVSRLRSGHRYTMGIIFHDSK
jgi:uncharacterized protein